MSFCVAGPCTPWISNLLPTQFDPKVQGAHPTSDLVPPNHSKVFTYANSNGTTLNHLRPKKNIYALKIRQYLQSKCFRKLDSTWQLKPKPTHWDVVVGTGEKIQTGWGKHHLGVSKNNGTPKSFILIGFSIINHPFWGTPIVGNIHLGYSTSS